MRTIAYFAHDSTDSTVVKRATAFQTHGAQVIGFMYRRRGRAEHPLAWENIALGVTEDRSYLARLPKLLMGVVIALRHAKALRQCDVLYARNIDMLLVAVLAKLLSASSAAVVYEVLDIRSIFLGRRLVNRLFRWFERRLMAACRLVVVSAPDHITEYLQAVQGYRGACFLLENKLPAQAFPPGAVPSKTLPPGPPWIIGLFGVLKCARSLDILCDVAERLRGKVIIYLRGVPSKTDIQLQRLYDINQKMPNVIYDGPYVNPRDLPEIYGKVHFIWAADFLDAGGNSDWCLANRIYEGGLMETVLLAASGNATGRMVEREKLGFTFTGPLADALTAFIEGLDAAQYERALLRVRSVERSVFVDETDTARLLEVMGHLERGEPIDAGSDPVRSGP